MECYCPNCGHGASLSLQRENRALRETVSAQQATIREYKDQAKTETAHATSFQVQLVQVQGRVAAYHILMDAGLLSEANAILETGCGA